jgi:hypothetical protein
LSRPSAAQIENEPGPDQNRNSDGGGRIRHRGSLRN